MTGWQLFDCSVLFRKFDNLPVYEKLSKLFVKLCSRFTRC
jgi:hypothetical protein